MEEIKNENVIKYIENTEESNHMQELDAQIMQSNLLWSIVLFWFLIDISSIPNIPYIPVKKKEDDKTCTETITDTTTQQEV